MSINHSFRIVRYSPAPEFIEPVNIALLIIDQHPRILHDDSFSKLSCAVPRCSHSAIRFWLDELRERVSICRPNEAHLAVTSGSSQMQVSESKALPSPLTKTTEGHLVELYLKRHLRRPHGQEKKSYIDGDEAARAYDMTAIKNLGDNAIVNFQDSFEIFKNSLDNQP